MAKTIDCNSIGEGSNPSDASTSNWEICEGYGRKLVHRIRHKHQWKNNPLRYTYRGIRKFTSITISDKEFYYCSQCDEQMPDKFYFLIKLTENY